LASGRRRLQHEIQLTRRAWEDVAPELQDMLNRLWEGQADGIPAGFNALLPENVEAGDSGTSGLESSGWAAADHAHPVVTGPPAGLANADIEGSSVGVPRLDHQHKRDVRILEDGSDVGTRNALDILNGIIEWSVTDVPGSDKVTLEATLSADLATFPKGGIIINPTGAANYDAGRLPYAATVVAVWAKRVGGGSATINARKNGSLTHLAANYTISAAGVWENAGAVQNTGYSAGDYLEIMLTALGAPNPTEVAIQVDFQRA
jgi:hypothetical protein